MKIIYGITKSNFGGAQRYVFDLATETRRAGHEVAVLCGGSGVLTKKLKENEVRIIEIKEMKRDISLVNEFRSFWFILQTLKKERPDVFHTNSSKMGGLGNLAARLAGINKIIFTSHGWEFNAPRPWWQKILIVIFTWFTLLLSHKTVCVSEKTKSDLKNFPFIQNKLSVVYNGIEKFELLEKTNAREKLGIHDNNVLLVGAISELHPVKGLDILLDAWAKFMKKRDAVLVILGDGEMRENLENLANKLGLENKVVFKGYMDNAKQYLNAFDIFCLPSRSEALPYALLEAGFAGLPAVATNVGGIPEIVENGISGALIPPEDSETLFSTLVLFSEDKNLRNRLGSAIHNVIEERFSIEKMVRQTFALY